MSKVKCVRKNIEGIEGCLVEGYISKNIYDSRFNVLGYEVKYNPNRGSMICLFDDFEIIEL